MHQLFARFLTAVVMLHATIGCRGHHAHSCEVGCCETQEASTDTCPCGSHGDVPKRADATLADHSDADDQQHQRQHDGPHRCEVDTCKFVRTDSSRVGETRTISTRLAVWVSSATSVAHLAQTVVATVPSSAVVACCTPRLHLVLAVMLI